MLRAEVGVLCTHEGKRRFPRFGPYHLPLCSAKRVKGSEGQSASLVKQGLTCRKGVETVQMRDALLMRMREGRIDTIFPPTHPLAIPIANRAKRGLRMRSRARDA